MVLHLRSKGRLHKRLVLNVTIFYVILVVQSIYIVSQHTFYAIIRHIADLDFISSYFHLIFVILQIHNEQYNINSKRG